MTTRATEHPVSRGGPPAAELWTAPGCPHCPRVRAALERLLAEGAVAALDVHDVSREPGRARELGIRAVPWLRLGQIEVQGLHGEGELRALARAAAGDVEALAAHVAAELEGGRLDAVLAAARRDPGFWVPALLRLLADEDTDLKARFGTSAALETLAAEGRLPPEAIETLGRLSAGERANLRADATYLLGLTRDPAARRWVEARLDDPDPQVREIAREALEAPDGTR